MATVALIQKLFPTLNALDSKQLTGLSQQVYDQFFEVIIDESGHDLQRAKSLADYQEAGHPKPDLVICAPIPEIGNIAPGFVELGRIRDAFPETPIIVWSNREEVSIQQTAKDDYGVVHYYTGTLLNAPDDIADLILEHT
jgi:hypothetical protein